MHGVVVNNYKNKHTIRQENHYNSNTNNVIIACYLIIRCTAYSVQSDSMYGTEDDIISGIIILRLIHVSF